MTVNNAENTNAHQTSTRLQTFLFRFVLVTAILLVAIPTLPMLISNLVYSFSGTSPKIYWYLSRASGFVTLSILWISMALGLGITNKMARLWPGAPTAFAMHQFTSLLGLAFSAYHALVLMGDHFVDFSLPRLIAPFSIAYQTFWVGVGQVCFYLWILAVVSFYFRQYIGQKAWRLIHYVNFAVYVMGFLHGLKSGTDSRDVWAFWYFAISGVGIMVLLGYRISDAYQKIKGSLPRFAFPQLQFQTVRERFKTSMKTLSIPGINSAYMLILWKQVKRLIPRRTQAGEMIPAQLETLTSSDENSPIKTLEGTVNEKKVRVRIFKEPVHRPPPELSDETESKQPFFMED